MSFEEQLDIIEMLAEHEEAIGELYHAYAGKFLDHRDFWDALSTEEAIHAGWIHTLQPNIKDKFLDSDKSTPEGSDISIEDHLKKIENLEKRRFKLQTIQVSLNSLHERLNDTSIKEISLIDALSIALDIEKSLIENRFFEFFETDPPELKVVLADLSRATKTHIERIKELWDRKRK